MKQKIFLLILVLSVAISNAQNSPPVAVNDTIDGVPGWDMLVNLTHNDYDPDGDPIFVGYVSMGYTGCYVVSDSMVYVTLSRAQMEDYYRGFTKLVYYVSDDTTSWGYSYDTGYVFIRYNDLMFYDSLNVNTVNAMFNCFGNHFWDLPGGEGSKFFVPNGSTQSSIFNNTLWIGGLDENGKIHTAAERYRQVGWDFFHGPVSNSYDSIYDVEWFRIWKLHKEEIEYHKNHWWQEEYEPIKDIAEWPGNGNPDLGQSEIIAPYYDFDNDSIYDPMTGDWPVIKGDQALFFVFNDDRNEHTESKGTSLGIEIRAMAYAFNEPSDSALWHTVFLNYEIENLSDTTYSETYIGTFTDIGVGNFLDDYVGSNVQHGYYFGYNGDEFDEYNTYYDTMNHGYGYHPPAQAVMILGGPYLDEDGIDNPRFDSNSHQLCDFSINGMNFGDTIVDNERLGMTGFIYMHNYGPFYSTEPQYPIDYYNYLKGYWRDESKLLYGGWNGHITTGSLGPECNFMFPGDSDTCNWGTDGIPPNGGYNQNGLYWTEEQVGNAPGDRRGLGISGPFTFEPGDVHEFDLAFVWARDYDGTALSSAELLEEYCASIKERFETDNDFFSSIPGNSISKNAGVTVYPNPVRDELNLSMNDIVEKGIVSIYNMKGEVLLETAFMKKRNLLIKTQQLPEGLYIIKLFDGTTNQVVKFIKK